MTETEDSVAPGGEVEQGKNTIAQVGALCQSANKLCDEPEYQTLVSSVAVVPAQPDMFPLPPHVLIRVRLVLTHLCGEIRHQTHGNTSRNFK